MKLLNLLNEILDEAIGDFNLGGIGGSGYGAGRTGMKIANLKNKFGGVSSTKGLGGVYKSSKQAKKALQNLGMSKVTIGSGIASRDILLTFSNNANINNIQYLYVTQQTLNTIGNICTITGNEFKKNSQNDKLYQFKAEKTDTRLLYELKKGGVMYYGMNNTTGKLYVPITYTTAPTTALMQEDIRFLTTEGYKSTDYKVYKFSLTIKP